MYDTQLNFYFMLYHLDDFTIKNYRDEILILFNNEDPLYYFIINIKYNIYMCLTNGIILYKLPFILHSLNDKDDVINDGYNSLKLSLDTYLSKLCNDNYPLMIGIFISSDNIYELYDKLDIKAIKSHMGKCINNISKMKSNLLMPIDI